jgi:hypothetical protein
MATARRFRRPAFDPVGPFMVRTEFLFNGRRYNPGETFEHDGIRVSRLKGLYRRRRIDLKSSAGYIKDPQARPIVPDWHSMDDKEIIRFCYKITGTRRRNPEIARAELAILEEAGALNAWAVGREVS